MSTTTPRTGRRAVAEPGRRIENPVQGDTVGFFETCGESGGRRTLMELDVAPGGARRARANLSYEETFTCVEGCLTVMVAGFPYELRPGQEVTVPAGIVHSWSNDEARRALALVELAPGHAGTETALRVLSGLAADGRLHPGGSPRSPLHAALVLAWGEARVPGLYGALRPGMRALAAVARLRGIDRELIERYA